jgi:RNA polymerase sigma-54 factor
MADRPQRLREHLAAQLVGSELTDDQRRLALHIVSFVDRTGYVGRRNEKDELVPISLLEIGSTFDPPVPPERVQQVLNTVQQLDPPGVAARDLRECLMLQIEPDTPHRDLVRKLIVDHLEDVAHNRLPAIHKGTGADLADIREALAALRHFIPKPGLKLSGDPPPGGHSR